MFTYSHSIAFCKSRKRCEPGLQEIKMEHLVRRLVLDRPTALNFDFGMFEDELGPESYVGPIRIRLRKPLHHHSRQAVSAVHGGQDAFKVNLDVQQFRPEEISVKTVNNVIVVEAKHEEREDEHGFISRRFTRKYILPDDYEPETVVSSLSSDGVLTISAPKKKLPPNVKEIIVPIIHTQAPAVRQQQANLKEDENQEKME